MTDSSRYGIYLLQSYGLNLDWLWQDYVLYNHYQTQFKKKVRSFGRQKMDIEKEKMRTVLSRALSQCGKPKQSIPLDTNHFCDNHEKDEFIMIDEVRNVQRIKSLEIISRLKNDSTKQR